MDCEQLDALPAHYASKVVSDTAMQAAHLKWESRVFNVSIDSIPPENETEEGRKMGNHDYDNDRHKTAWGLHLTADTSYNLKKT